MARQDYFKGVELTPRSSQEPMILEASAGEIKLHQGAAECSDLACIAGLGE